MDDFYRLLPVLTLFIASAMFVGLRRLGLVLENRRDRRRKAEEREYARITGWIKKIRTEGAGPAVTRDEHGNLVLFKGLRPPSRFELRRGQHRR